MKKMVKEPKIVDDRYKEVKTQFQSIQEENRDSLDGKLNFDDK